MISPIPRKAIRKGGQDSLLWWVLGLLLLLTGLRLSLLLLGARLRLGLFLGHGWLGCLRRRLLALHGRGRGLLLSTLLLQLRVGWSGEEQREGRRAG